MAPENFLIGRREELRSLAEFGSVLRTGARALVIEAPEGMGKTALATNMAFHAARLWAQDAADGAEQTQRHDQDDRQRQEQAFVLGRQDQEDQNESIYL